MIDKLVNELILKPQFVDRKGRTVYFIHERSGEKRYYSVGDLVGQVRLTGPGGSEDGSETAEIEWMPPEDE